MWHEPQNLFDAEEKEATLHGQDDALGTLLILSAVALLLVSGLALYEGLRTAIAFGIKFYAFNGLALCAGALGGGLFLLRDIRKWRIIAAAQIVLGSISAVLTLNSLNDIYLKGFMFAVALIPTANGFEKFKKLHDARAARTP